MLSSVLLAKAAGSVTLRFHPKVGTTYRYGADMSMKMDMGGAGKAPPMPNGFKVDASYKIISSSGGKYKVLVSSGLAKGQPAPMGASAGAQEATVTVDELGKTSGGAVKGMLSQTLASGIQGISFPKGPVAVGAKWTQDADVSAMAGQMTQMGMKPSGRVVSTYVVKAIRKVGGTTLVDLTADVAGTITLTGQMTMKMNQSGKGIVTIDAGTGMVQTQIMDLNTKVDFAGRPITSTNHLAMKLLK